MTNVKLEQERMRAELTKLREELGKIKAKAAREQAVQRIKFDRYLEKLDEKSAEVSAKLETMDEMKDDAVDEIRAGLREVWQRLDIAKQAAAARFQ